MGCYALHVCVPPNTLRNLNPFLYYLHKSPLRKGVLGGEGESFPHFEELKQSKYDASFRMKFGPSPFWV
jgi:hypothetical protein